MKYFLLFNLLFINFFHLYSNDYIINMSGKKTLITKHVYSNKHHFSAIKLDGAFTDNFGNYGDFDSFVTIIIKQNAIHRVDFSNKFFFQNNESFFMEGQRKEGGQGTGVGEAIIISTDESFKDMLNSKCVYSIKYFNDTFFSIIKCNISDAALEKIQNVKEVKIKN